MWETLWGAASMLRGSTHGFLLAGQKGHYLRFPGHGINRRLQVHR